MALDERYLIVDGYGISINAERGHLVVIDGFANEGNRRETHFPRGRCKIQRLIVRSQSGTISLAALDWCMHMGISVAFVASDSSVINCYLPPSASDGPLKRAQAVAGLSETGVEIARNLLRRKFQAQKDSLKNLLPSVGIRNRDEHAVDQTIGEIDASIAALANESELHQFLAIEGRVAQIYWKHLHGTRLPWLESTLKRIPEHWAQIWPRENGNKSRVRDATDPFNAILNYGYTLLEIETRIACHADGLDPDMGLIHVDDRLRESLIYDLMEPIRCFVEAQSFAYISKKGLRSNYFHELVKGVVRLDPDFAKAYTHWLMPQLRSHVKRSVMEFVREIRSIIIPYRLIDERPALIAERTRKGVGGPCTGCGTPLKKSGQKFCSRPCYLKYSVEVLQPVKLAQAKHAELRAQGIKPGHTPEAEIKRGNATAIANRRRAMNITMEEYRTRQAEASRRSREKKKIEKMHDK